MTDNALASLSVADHATGRPRGLGAALDAALLRLVSGRLAGGLDGELRLTLPSGLGATLGRRGPREASLAVRRYRAIPRAMRRGLVGFAASYIEGDIDTPSLDQVFELYLANEARLSRAVPGLGRSAGIDRRYHAGRANTRAGSRRNIAAHYDLGNEFYALWLDPSLSYSSAIYSRSDASLEEAQAEKHSRIVAALDLAPGRSLLEIGCGWGSVAEAAARAGADVTAITISERQHAAAAARLAHAGLAGRARVVLQDYRDTTGIFDRLVSIEMIEAVGAENWAVYFRSIADRLAPGGHGIIQAITIRDDLYDGYSRRPDFIQRYIFPGGMLPTVGLMRANAEAAGLGFCEIERFGGSYARTLADWQARFQASWPAIEAQGFDQRFRRMWDYYLAYCAAGFRHGLIDVGLYRVAKPATAARSGS